MKKIHILLIICVLFSISIKASAQHNYTQTVRGIIVDKASQSPIPGAYIKIINQNPPLVAVSDANGNFKLTNVPVGLIDIQVEMISYQNVLLRNIKLTSGKELVLTIEMEEKVTNIDKIVINGYRKDRPLNNMANVSARSFSVEDADRYAGSWMDPARMVSNYAGVMAIGDQRNDIIIRGNSPLGVLWRLEDIDIPNPNHFGTLGTTGGPVSILNNNTLSNSDFFTGAFPAEYGNATAGIFDLNLRSGNNEKQEYTAQISMNGLELGAEGPFSKNGASYLIYYRYSNLKFFDLIGLNYGVSGVPQFQDLTFKINIPKTKTGKWEMFGIGGKSYILALYKDRDPDDWTFGHGDLDFRFGSDMGAVGITNRYFFNNTTRLETAVSLSGSQNSARVDSAFKDRPSELYYGDRSYEIRYSANTKFIKKINAKNTFNAGVSCEFYEINYQDSVKNKFSDEFIKLSEANDETPALIQSYVQIQHKFSQNLLIYSGIHYQLFTLNNSMFFEPRASFRWNFTENQSFTGGFGYHSQLAPRLIYFIQTELDDSSKIYTNKDLDFYKSKHFVFGYNWLINKNLRLKIETYYQYLYDIPVEQKASTYSLINYGTKFFVDRIDSLVNGGTGKNYGIELTFEKFLSQNYYFLITASVFDSKYTASDGIERNTAFNGNYVINGLCGYTFEFNKNNSLSIDSKVVFAGNKRYIPVDIDKSNLYGVEILDYSQAYEPQYDPYFRLDGRISYHKNFKKFNTELAFDVQNLTNHKNIMQQSYDPETQSLRTDYQLGLFYIFLFRVQF